MAPLHLPDTVWDVVCVMPELLKAYGRPFWCRGPGSQREHDLRNVIHIARMENAVSVSCVSARVQVTIVLSAEQCFDIYV